MKISKLILLLIMPFFISCTRKEVKKYYYENGKLRGEIELIDNVRHGKQILYYKNGHVESIVFWKKGKQDSLSTFYYENGKLKSESLWKENKPNGYYKNYYLNGKIKNGGFYKNGVPDGPCKAYFEDGTLQLEGNYKDSIKHGYQKRYFKNGQIASLEYFLKFRGKETLVGYIKYYEDGKIEKQTPLFVLAAEKDTISIGEEFKLRIQLERPYFDSTRAIIANYDDDFYLLNNFKADTIKAINHSMIYKDTARALGKHIVRGYIDNYKIIKRDSIVHSHEYFEYSFYVKGKRFNKQNL